jgi:pyridoxine 4-dehydrogenase
MIDISVAGVFSLGDRTVNRLGYGAMQLAGPRVFGPPKDRDAALAVLRAAVAGGVNHIDTSDFMARTSPTSLFAKRFIRIPTTS